MHWRPVRRSTTSAAAHDVRARIRPSAHGGRSALSDLDYQLTRAIACGATDVVLDLSSAAKGITSPEVIAELSHRARIAGVRLQVLSARDG